MSIRDSESFNWHSDAELEDQDLHIRGQKLFFIVVLFSIVVLFTALFLFARRICHHHGLLFDAVPPQQAPPTLPSDDGLDADAIKRLPIILHQRTAAEETECCICLGAFVDGAKLKVLPGCEHSFHSECVDKWLANHSNCPLCRASLKLNPSLPRILIQSPPVRTTLPL
ncbi:RING-H2 finger protein ATL66-like [Vigna umbellata]|uniref:RING-H2 finger protein n=2 Tax=Phaseolus angularis TaxID=3914 RepID=A0A0L9UWG9_PHAAN|nr:RING-H2 finger protein ATL66 [Vigna angularis]XP_047166584.1 RING-H2 finger protein ATL66-like [Vigna umbellata]KAG2391190.1 RING-H2 finger protein [Vigna angularis]KOM46884.1 hypothetical protein LR48_Vigan07g058800 [Vigna angularis]BAT81100.1 hypothetical protein VIGAN_03075600 [Vigna angularis var. angularis]